MSSTVIDTLQKTGVGSSPIQGQSRAVDVVQVFLIKTELGLDGGTVNAIGVKALASALSKLHVLGSAVRVDREGHLQMQASHDLGV